MELSKFLNIVRRYLWLVVLIALLASLTTFLMLNKEPTNYQAKVRLLVGPGLDSPSPDLNSLKIGAQLMQTYAGLINSGPFLESVNNKLSHKIDVDLLNTIIVNRQNLDTRVLTIIVYYQDPKEAIAIANAAAETLIEMSPSKNNNTTALLRTQMSEQSQELEKLIANANTSIQQLETELIALGNAAQEKSPIAAKANSDQQKLIAKQLVDERSRLSDALRTLATIYQVLLDTNTNQVEVIDPAVVALPVDKNLSLSVASSGISGLILAAIIIFGVEYFDDRIRFPADFTRAAKVPLLTKIDKHNRLDGSGLARVTAFAQPESLAANNYHTAVAKLLFSIGESMPYTLMVSSVGPQSGDDTVDTAANLAVVFAQAGNRVVLVDAQLHNPGLTGLFNADGKAGLVDLLATNPPKLQLIHVKDVPGLRLLPAGILSKMNSGMALNSVKIAKQIEELKKDADIVLVTSSPISWFAESLTLASLVNGVMLVARSGEAHGKVVTDVVENLRVMNIPLVGVIFDQNSSTFVSKQNLENNFSAEVPAVSENSHV